MTASLFKNIGRAGLVELGTDPSSTPPIWSIIPQTCALFFFFLPFSCFFPFSLSPFFSPLSLAHPFISVVVYVSLAHSPVHSLTHVITIKLSLSWAIAPHRHVLHVLVHPWHNGPEIWLVCVIYKAHDELPPLTEAQCSILGLHFYEHWHRKTDKGRKSKRLGMGGKESERWRERQRKKRERAAMASIWNEWKEKDMWGGVERGETASVI